MIFLLLLNKKRILTKYLLFVDIVTKVMLKNKMKI